MIEGDSDYKIVGWYLLGLLNQARLWHDARTPACCIFFRSQPPCFSPHSHTRRCNHWVIWVYSKSLIPLPLVPPWERGAVTPCSCSMHVASCQIGNALLPRLIAKPAVFRFLLLICDEGAEVHATSNFQWIPGDPGIRPTHIFVDLVSP